MKIPYRTRRLINRIGFISTILLMILVVFWFCWVIFVERYVVYTPEGAKLDMTFNANAIVGEVASPPQAGQHVDIYYNEGLNSMETSNALAQLDGYYIDLASLEKNIGSVWENLEHLPTGTPVMIDLKGGLGTFCYTSSLSGANRANGISVESVDEMVKLMQQKGYYTIARISAFRDYYFGLNNVPSGLYMLNRKGLWADSGGCYWLNPTDAKAINWVASIVLELKALGFREVVLTDFCFPNSDRYIFNGDKNAALQEAAQKLMSICGSDTFTLSFAVDSAAFPMPGERCRLYLENVDAGSVGAKASQAAMENPEIHLVFVAATNDTRYNDYSVLRPISVSDVLEAQKAEKEEQAKNTP